MGYFPTLFEVTIVYAQKDDSIMGYCQAKKVVDFQCYCRLFERVFDRTSKTIAAQTKLFGEKKKG